MMQRMLRAALAVLLLVLLPSLAGAQTAGGSIANPRPLTAQAIRQALGYTPGRGQWYAAPGVPSAGVGQSGDLYLSTTSGQVYQNSGGAWSLVSNITGPTGATGAAGAAAWSTLSAGFTMPAAASTVSVSIGSTAWMTAGQTVYVAAAGYLTVTAVTDGVTAVLTNPGLASNAAPGTAIPAAVLVTAAGAPGAGSVSPGTAGAIAGYPAGGDTIGPITALPSGTTASTPAAGDSSGKVATSQFVSGALGGTVLRSYLAGLTLSTPGASSVMAIASGVAADSTNSQMMALASPFTKTTGSWSAGTGNGALDTGTIANSTWYHWYLIKRPDTGAVDVLTSLDPGTSGTVTVTVASPAVVSWPAHGLSVGAAVVFSTTGALPTGLVAGTTYYVISAGFGTNAFEVSTSPGGAAVGTSGTQSGTHTATANPTLPANYTLFRRIGAGRTNASAQWAAFTQVGDTFYWASAVADVNGASLNTASAQYQLASLPQGINVTAIVDFSYGGGGTGVLLIYSPLQATGSASGGRWNMSVNATNGGMQAHIITDTAAHVNVAVNFNCSPFYIYTEGWVDRRGRDY